jgi:hypothetical protein
MKLLTKEILKAFEKQGDTSEKRAEDVKVIAKFFNPGGAGTWFATEYDPERRVFFGYANIGDDLNAEPGYFSLDELESFRGRFGLKIERDMYFGNHTLKEVVDKKGRL